MTMANDADVLLCKIFGTETAQKNAGLVAEDNLNYALGSRIGSPIYEYWGRLPSTVFGRYSDEQDDIVLLLNEILARD